MGAIRTPRDRRVEAGLQALADNGPATVRVEVLAKKLGVTKGGCCGYFADRTRDQVLTRAVDRLLDRPGATTAADPAPRPGAQDEELAG